MKTGRTRNWPGLEDRALAVALAYGLFIVLLAPTTVVAAEEAALSSALSDAEFREPERIVMMRFARAFGRLSREHDPDLIINGEADVAAERLEAELEEDGLQIDDWNAMLTAMRENDDFRNRVENLSSVYRLGE